MKTRTTKEYRDCNRCYGNGSTIDQEMSIFGTVFSAYFGGLYKTCKVCEGSGRVLEKEETIEETT